MGLVGMMGVATSARSWDISYGIVTFCTGTVRPRIP